jgi:hypothetical protein
VSPTLDNTQHQAYVDEIKTGTSRIDYEVSSWRGLEQWFLAHLRLQQKYHMTRGCPYGTLGSEVSVDEELIRQDVSLIFELIKRKLAAFFIKEKAKGRLTVRADPERIADFCVASIQGAMLMGKVTGAADLSRRLHAKPSPTSGAIPSRPRGDGKTQ